MSNGQIRKRLDELRKALQVESIPGVFQAVLVEGGLTPYPAIAQDDKGDEWIRDFSAGETVEDFAHRAVWESKGSGAHLCTIGGMPLPTASEAMRWAMKAASDYYYENEYSDVPPMESR